MIALRAIPSPRIHEAIVSYESICFVGWDVARPSRTVSCTGLNERQAVDHAAIQLGVSADRIRVRRAPQRATNGKA